MHRVEFTKNILAGDRQGEQIQDAVIVCSARAAALRALALNSGGIFQDVITRDPFTAHNVRIVAIEEELPELVENGGRGWDRYEAADFAYDSMIEASL
jgi:hypothetical protein